MMTDQTLTFRELPGASYIIGPKVPDPPAEVVPAIPSHRSLTAIMAFKEVLRRVPQIKELRRPSRVRRLTSVAERRHEEYLRRISSAADTEPALISPQTAELAQRLWQSVRSQVVKRVPAASVGEDGAVLYAWDSGDHHLEAEIREGQPIAWMYANRQSGETWFGSQGNAAELPSEVLARFRRID
jgi:hypothetical protein